MTPTATLQAPAAPATSEAPAPTPAWRRAVACAALSGCAAMLAASSLPAAGALATMAVLACAATALGTGGLGSRSRARRLAAGPGASRAAGDVDGARVMGHHIVPVWRRQLEASRAEAERGVNQLLQHFSKLSASLNDLLATSEDGPGQGVISAEALLERHPDALDLVRLPAQRLRAERAAWLDTLRTLETSQTELQREGAQILRLGRHAGLLAMNASIEAHRAGADDGGFTAVATEMRELSRHAEAHGQRVEALVKSHSERLVTLRRQIELADAGDEAEAIEQRHRAIAWIDRLIGDLGATLQSAQPLRKATQDTREGIDALFADFQFQDRMHQMTSALQQDMVRFEAWLDGPDPGSAREAMQWLERLEQTYTMQEQHAHHHGNVEIRHSGAVEFF